MYLDEAVIEDGVKSLLVTMSLTHSEDIHRKFAETKTDKDVRKLGSRYSSKNSPRYGVLCVNVEIKSFI